MWQANPTWGSPRIVGELQKFGIDIAKSTVERYRPKLRGPTSPSWATDLSRLKIGHGATNMAIVRPFALNLVRPAKDKRSIKTMNCAEIAGGYYV